MGIFSTVEPNPNDRFQVDAPATERVMKQNKCESPVFD